MILSELHVQSMNAELEKIANAADRALTLMASSGLGAAVGASFGDVSGKGHWRKLGPGKRGKDKSGGKIYGKTWVTKAEDSQRKAVVGALAGGLGGAAVGATVNHFMRKAVDKKVRDVGRQADQAVGKAREKASGFVQEETERRTGRFRKKVEGAMNLEGLDKSQQKAVKDALEQDVAAHRSKVEKNVTDDANRFVQESERRAQAQKKFARDFNGSRLYRDGLGEGAPTSFDFDDLFMLDKVKSVKAAIKKLEDDHIESLVEKLKSEGIEDKGIKYFRTMSDLHRPGFLFFDDLGMMRQLGPNMGRFKKDTQKTFESVKIIWGKQTSSSSPGGGYRRRRQSWDDWYGGGHQRSSGGGWGGSSSRTRSGVSFDEALNVLGIKKSVKTKKEAKKAWRDYARANHPDLGRTEEEIRKRTETFQRGSNAWDEVKASSWFEKLASYQASEAMQAELWKIASQRAENRKKLLNSKAQRYGLALGSGAAGAAGGYIGARTLAPKVRELLTGKAGPASSRTKLIASLASAGLLSGLTTRINRHTHGSPTRQGRLRGDGPGLQPPDRELAQRHEGHPSAVPDGLLPRDAGGGGSVPLGAGERSSGGGEGGGRDRKRADHWRRRSDQYRYRREAPRNRDFSGPVRLRGHLT